MEHTRNQISATRDEFWRGVKDGFLSCSPISAPRMPKPLILNSSDNGIENYWKTVGLYIKHNIDKYEKEQRPSA